jgi:peptide-methionine (S)-S-oxide reductase
MVCTGTTGHAEVVQITFDPSLVTYTDLLEVFFKTHDPTTLNRQGNDHGTQYRSVIFYHDDEQKADALAIKERLDASGTYARPIVTEIAPAPEFYPAEKYHQNYYRDNATQPYCRVIIAPKVEKVRTSFQAKLRGAEPGRS